MPVAAGGGANFYSGGGHDENLSRRIIVETQLASLMKRGAGRTQTKYFRSLCPIIPADDGADARDTARSEFAPAPRLAPTERARTWGTYRLGHISRKTARTSQGVSFECLCTTHSNTEPSNA